MFFLVHPKCPYTFTVLNLFKANFVESQCTYIFVAYIYIYIIFEILTSVLKHTTQEKMWEMDQLNIAKNKTVYYLTENMFWMAGTFLHFDCVGCRFKLCFALMILILITIIIILLCLPVCWESERGVKSVWLFVSNLFSQHFSSPHSSDISYFLKRWKLSCKY